MSDPRLDPPETVREIAATLENAGFETWCVGGAIRDALLGHPHLDWDLATAAHPEKVRKLFKRTVPVGIEFGTVGVLDKHGTMHEVTTFRRDIKTDGRHAVVEFGASLEEDLARRDLTINAMAYSPVKDAFADPFGGRRDLEKRVVRAVGDPRQRMTEDRLRALRAIRFAARFGFEIDPETWSAIVESGAHLSRLSPERVRQEIEKTMQQAAAPSKAFAMWHASGAFGTLIPPLANADVRSFRVLDCLPLPSGPRSSQRKSIRVAALFALVPSATASKLLRALRFSNTEINWTTALIDRWQSLHTAMTHSLSTPAGADDAELRRWAARAGRTMLAPLVRLASAFWASDREKRNADEESNGARSSPSEANVRSAYRRALKIAYRDPIEVADLAVDGDDLNRAGITGPAVGVTLRNLLETVINDPSANTRDNLLGLIVARRGSGQAQP